MSNHNYLKNDFYNHLKEDQKLFEKVIVSNKRYFFVWDYENKEQLWVSKCIWYKLGFKSKGLENDLSFWKSKLSLLNSSEDELNAILESKNPKLELSFITSNEQKIQSQASIFAIRNPDKTIRRVIGVLKDKDLAEASKEKRSAKNLIENQDRFKFISENISDGIYIIEDNELVFTSSTYLKMMKLSVDKKKELHNIDMFALIHPDDRDRVVNAIYSAANDKLSSVKYVFRCRNGVGDYIWREDIMNIQYKDSGDAFRAITIARDITQEKNQDLENLNKQNAIDLQNRLLLKLYSNISDKNIDEKITEITTTAADGLEIDRASFWEINDDFLACRSLFDKVENRHSQNHLLDTREIPKYITAVNSLTALVADNVYDNDSTTELIESYLKPQGITDMLDVPVRANGKFYGVFCCEHRNDPRVWSDNDISFARALADYLSLALEEQRRKEAEFKLKENQEKLKFISENTSDGIVVYENSKVIYVSPAYVRLSGYSEESLIGLDVQEIFDHIHPDDVAKVKSVVYKNLENREKRFSFDYRLRGTDGLYYWREDSANVVYDDNSSLYSTIIIISRDITERKKTDEKLIESERQLRLITENTSDGVIVFEKSKIAYVSPSYTKLLGYAKEDCETFTMDDIFEKFHPDDLITVRPFIYDCLSKKMKEFKYEFRFKGTDGNYYWREDSANVIYGDDGKYLKYIIVTRDILARKEAEKEKNRLYDITEKQNEKLINFTHIVSHDIRSHTSNLSMILDLYEDSNDIDEQKEYFSMLKQSTNKLSDTIFYLNETVAIQSGVKSKKVLLSLHNEIEKTILGINAIIKTNNAIININVDESLEVVATQSYLESIIFNVLTNAIKYKSLDRDPVININASKVDDEVKLAIQDNGIGIDLIKNKDKIFGMYKTFSNNPDAVGLGLFMVKNHIESMGGRIEVESELGKGTTFNLYFI